MAPIIVLILIQAGILWLTFRQFGRNGMSLLIAVLAVLTLCPWFTPYETAEPFILGQPWWLTVWMALWVLLVVLMYIRLFRTRDRHGTAADLEEMWKEVTAAKQRIEKN